MKEEPGDFDSLVEMGARIDSRCHEKLPFCTMRIDTWEDRCKHFVKQGEKTITLKQLRAALKRDVEWAGDFPDYKGPINQSDSPLIKLLISDAIRTGEKFPLAETKLNVNKLITLGLLLCPSNPGNRWDLELKARVVYDMVVKEG